MGILLSSYNPFSVYGQYNIKTYLYENKKNVIIILSVVLLFIVALILAFGFGYDPPTEKVEYNIPPPKYFNGPYGFDLYLPPRNVLLDSI